ncbi:MAG: flagellar protein FliT [Burkholderiales bacterium]
MSNATLPYYESIAHVSELMLASAQEGDWEGVMEAERCAASLIARLRAVPAANAALDEAGARRKREIIRKVLAEDALIRDLSHPWLRKADAYLKPVAFGRGGRGTCR